MALGGFSSLTPEQRGRCLLLGIEVMNGTSGLSGKWFIARTTESGLQVLVDNQNELIKYDNVDDALNDYIQHKDERKWA